MKPITVTRFFIYLFIALALMYIFSAFASCTSVHKATKTVARDSTTINKTKVQETTKTSVVITEKKDTTINTRADSATIKTFIPDTPAMDTADHTQEIKKGAINLIIHTKNKYDARGNRTGTEITANAIKLAEAVNFDINKTTVINTDQKINTDNNIKTDVKQKTVDKTVSKTRMPVWIWFLIAGIILLAAFYFYIKHQY